MTMIHPTAPATQALAVLLVYCRQFSALFLAEQNRLVYDFTKSYLPHIIARLTQLAVFSTR
jgi:hypothetical protein